MDKEQIVHDLGMMCTHVKQDPQIIGGSILAKETAKDYLEKAKIIRKWQSHWATHAPPS